MPTLEAERLERLREELNALYVALTRARHTLAISSIEPYRAAERSWWLRLADLAIPITLPEQAALPRDNTKSSKDVFFIKELPPAPVECAQVAIKIEAFSVSGVSQAGAAGTPPGATNKGVDEGTDSLAARIGKAMHRLLEWGDASGNNTAAAAREFELTPEQGVQAAAMAGRILQGEGAWAWDKAVLGWQGNEVELMYLGVLLRLDRLVQRKDGAQAGHWWVLDYKSALSPQNQPALVEQLRGYQAAVQVIYPDEVVRAAFLTPQGALIEIQLTPE